MESRIKYKFEENAITTTRSGRTVAWTIANAAGSHPFRSWLEFDIQLETLLDFSDPDKPDASFAKKGQVDVQVGSPDLFNSRNQPRSKIFAILATWRFRVILKESMTFEIGPKETI